jgi:hypothetical protein
MATPSFDDQALAIVRRAYAHQILAVAAGVRDALKASFERGGFEFVRSLVWQQPFPRNRCWFAASDWALSYDEAG